MTTPRGTSSRSIQSVAAWTAAKWSGVMAGSRWKALSRGSKSQTPISATAGTLVLAMSRHMASA